MSQTKRIVVSVPEELLLSMDDLRAKDGSSRSAMVREAIRLLLHQRREAAASLERLRRGYERMGRLNRRLAEEGLAADLAVCEAYERGLAGREDG
ncbi:MAG: ribbon-helix-helix protein, CopG family [Firmicutes bacterium]|nr:ribbon-helix-helix protein, CopG family [Bacillota bacterium]